MLGCIDLNRIGTFKASSWRRYGLISASFGVSCNGIKNGEERGFMALLDNLTPGGNRLAGWWVKDCGQPEDGGVNGLKNAVCIKPNNAKEPGSCRPLVFNAKKIINLLYIDSNFWESAPIDDEKKSVEADCFSRVRGLKRAVLGVKSVYLHTMRTNGRPYGAGVKESPCGAFLCSLRGLRPRIKNRR